MLRKLINDNTIVISDIGSHYMWIAHYLRVYNPRKLLFSNGQQTLGVALPWAIGAYFAGERDIVSISGDGGFLFSATELETAVRENIHLIHFVWTDGHYDMVRQQQLLKYDRQSCVTLGKVDTPKFAESFGEYLTSEALDLYELVSKNYLNVNKVLAARSPWTLVHQDCRVENMLFGEIASDRVAVIDWQGIGRGPASYDLAYLLGGSVETDLRREHEDRWISLYHETLLEEGVLTYSIKDLREDYQMSHLQGGLATAMFTAGSLNLSNERGLQLEAE
mgnify:CR=1 FL=1